MERLRFLLTRARGAIAFWRGVVLALVLALIGACMDHTGITHELLPDSLLVSIDATRTLLSTMAGVYLTITTFTFSAILTVLSTYSSTYSPRVGESFLSGRLAMRVLGLFVGGFLYSILALLLLKSADEGSQVVSAAILIFYSALAMGSFIAFILGAAHSLQCSELVNGLVHEADATIDRCLVDYPGRVRVANLPEQGRSHALSLRFRHNGFLGLVDVEEILARFREVPGTLVLLPMEGDFLSENQVIARVLHDGSIEVAQREDLEEKLAACLQIESEREVRNDYRYAVERLAEVALRAISPGINDPNTAIHCLHFMGVLMGRVAAVSENCTLVQPDNDSKFSLVYPDFLLDSDLQRLYAPLAHYASGDLSVMVALLESLASVRRVATRVNREVVDNFALYCLERVRASYEHERDLEFLAGSAMAFQSVAEQARRTLGPRAWEGAEARERLMGAATHRLNLIERIEDEVQAEAAAAQELREAEQNQ